jgi:hypothetical protein
MTPFLIIFMDFDKVIFDEVSNPPIQVSFLFFIY